MAKNKKAPARAKAIDESYLLTTKLFCGHCNCAMTGVSGISATGKSHQYYCCEDARLEIHCNVNEQTMKSPLGESVNSSPKEQLAK